MTTASTNMPTDAHESPGLRMIITMGIIGLVAGALIVLTYQLTFPIIEHNKAVALERAIFEVIPGAQNKSTFRVDGRALVPYAGDDATAREFHAGYDAEGQLVGVAIEASGQGFQDIIRILYGYSPDCECIVGMKVLESKETPGLGDKIAKDPGFRENFAALSVALSDNNEEMRNEITLAKHGKKSDAWQIEAITGATISSRAIANILRASSADAVPMIQKNIDALRNGAK